MATCCTDVDSIVAIVIFQRRPDSDCNLEGTSTGAIGAIELESTDLLERSGYCLVGLQIFLLGDLLSVCSEGYYYYFGLRYWATSSGELLY